MGERAQCQGAAGCGPSCQYVAARGAPISMSQTLHPAEFEATVANLRAQGFPGAPTPAMCLSGRPWPAREKGERRKMSPVANACC